MQSSSARLTCVNTFGTLGYLSLVMQWVWCLLIVGYPFISGDHALLFPVDAPRISPQPQAVDFGVFSPVAFVVASAISLLVLVATVVTVARLPRAVGKKGAQTTQAAAHAIIPTLTHHKKLSKTRSIRLTYQVVIGLKLLGTLFALLPLINSSSIPQLSHDIVLTVGGFCAICTSLWFGIQYILARLFRLKRDQIW